jgi:DNA polymerase-3 subunit beta
LTLGFKNKSCVVKKDNAMLVMRLLEARFPDYRAVIPKKVEYSLKVGRIPLLEGMRKMLILSNERYRAVRVFVENDAVELVSTNPDLGEAREKLPVTYAGNRIEMGFNPRYFIDTLQVMESEVVELGFVDEAKPCMLNGEADEGFLGLLMPMRL